jgi:two-component system sensor histidine kinase/response regulator
MSNPVFDKQGSLQRVDNDWELLGELVSLFYEEYTSQIRELKEALAQKDGRRFKLCAHTIKGAAGNIGAMQVFEQAFALERLATSGEFEQVAKELPHFEAAIAEFRRIFDAAVR